MEVSPSVADVGLPFRPLGSDNRSTAVIEVWHTEHEPSAYPDATETQDGTP